MKTTQTSLSRVPLVTVAIPFWNPGPLLMDAVRAVFSQTMDDWELILLDDGSTDGSTECARRISDPRVRVLSDGKHLGLVPRLNQIADLASGEYLARMDADDLMAPRRLEKQVGFLQAHNQFQVVSSGAVMIDERNLPVGSRRIPMDQLMDARRSLRYGMVIHAAILARRSWFEINRYDAAYIRDEDRELFARVRAQGQITQLDELLYFIKVPQDIRVRSFLESYRSERKVLLAYGPSQIGWPDTLGLLAGSWARSLLLPLFCRFGFKPWLLRRLQGAGTLDQHEASTAQQDLERIFQTDVPGIGASPYVGVRSADCVHP